MFAGAVIFADLRRSGWNVARQSADELDRLFKPWAHGGLAILLATGVLMTSADWDRYRRNPAFSVKMALLVLALVSYFAPRRRKPFVFSSLALWTAVVLAARAIADFDI